MRTQLLTDGCKLREEGHGSLAALIDNRADGKVKQLMFIHLEEEHWTMQSHDLTVRPVEVTSWNSLADGRPPAISGQVSIATIIQQAQTRPEVSGDQAVKLLTE